MPASFVFKGEDLGITLLDPIGNDDRITAMEVLSRSRYISLPPHKPHARTTTPLIERT